MNSYEEWSSLLEAYAKALGKARLAHLHIHLSGIDCPRKRKRRKTRGSKMNAKEVAEYFLYKAALDEEPITNLKLQKLLYYAQGFSLVLLKHPLFPETLQAWTHGPVVPGIYYLYKQYGSDPIPSSDEIDLNKYDKESVELMDEVYEVYGQFSGFALRNMTHQEPPWRETPSGADIDLSLMEKYFKTKVEDNGG